MSRTTVLIFVASATTIWAQAAVAIGASAGAGDANRGQTLYQSRCTTCHSIDYNFGRKAGSLADYTYSPALQASTVIWSAQTLDKWLSNPEKFIPGQKMGFTVPDAKDRADLIAYLKKETAAKP
jgi:cytochrome c